ncbi:MAG: hypothetical protein HY292_02720 [Planctomycetes bacterium]|nr:hypothetical protein [Planctomycetota bacterium]
MTRSRIVKLVLFPAVILVAVITAYRIGATTSARPVASVIPTIAELFR